MVSVVSHYRIDLRRCHTALFRLPILAEGLGEQPRFSGRWLGVTEVICKLVRSSFYFFVETFDSVPIPVCKV